MTDEHGRPILAISVGEPAGIGPDICLALAQRNFNATLICIADPDVLSERAKLLGIDIEITEVASARRCPSHRPNRLTVLPIKAPTPVSPGSLDVRNAGYVLECLDAAITLARSGQADAVVTAPLHKGIINDAGHLFTGHTEYLTRDSDANTPVMMLVSGDLRVALVTTHMPLRNVPDALDDAKITHVISVVAKALKNQFGVSHPRIAVCGLNPHAGESGHFGREDDEIIRPAIAHASAANLTISGPLPADTAFTAAARDSFDAYITMYHDQGLPVIKALGFGEIVNVTLGLPIIRTSVDHGTALSIAGSGTATPNSMISAVTTAIDLISGANK